LSDSQQTTDMVTFEKHVAGLSELALKRFVARARRAAGVRGPVHVLVTSNAKMRSLNWRFRGEDRATDVLSFPAAGDGAERFTGDIAISAEIAAQNARSLGHAPGVEVKILVLHGTLHLRGYDHERDHGQMARREQKLRRELRLPSGLIERDETSAGTREGSARDRRRRA
jgi:probable rRNA maturation factor